MRRESLRARRARAGARVRQNVADRRLKRAVEEIYPDRYTGPATPFGLSPGPCVYERKWAGGCVIRTVDGRLFTVARKYVERGKR